MRVIEREVFISAVKKLLIQAHYFLPDDFLEEIKNCISQEKNELAKDVLIKILENAKIASVTKLPLCQDTGIPQFFLEIGKNVCFNFDIISTLKEVVYKIYEEEYLRKSCVLDPLVRNQIFHFTNLYVDYIDEDEKFRMYVLIRGGGSENTSYTTNFLPTADLEDITKKIVDIVINMLPYSCPPGVVGVGIGGTFEQSAILAKKALLRKIRQRNKIIIYAELEKKIKNEINSYGIGPLGLGGGCSVLDVFIETAPTHIATLPVSVILQCHSYRRQEIEL